MGLRAASALASPGHFEVVTDAVPKRKVSRMKRGTRRRRRSQRATYVEDKESGELRRPHHIDLKSGKYRGRQILEAKEIFGVTLAAEPLERGARQTFWRALGRP